MNKKLIFSVLSFIYVVILVLGSSIIKPNSVLPSDGLDYFAHILGFMVLAILLSYTFRFYGLKNKLLISASSSFALSLIVELLRIPGRGFSGVDFLLDILGVIIGLVLVWSFSKR